MPQASAGKHEPHHRNIHEGGARAAVFGISDGLVSNLALILGMAGAHVPAATVRLVGLAGLVAGACSMASGEYVSMRAQTELMQRELAVERDAIEAEPESEQRELVQIYLSRGIEPALAKDLAEEVMSDPDVALETHAREELGIDPGRLGRPVQAALSSFMAFAVGAFLPLLPWLWTSGGAATLLSIVIATVASLVVGATLALFTGRSWLWSATRQLLFTAGAAGATYLIGHAIGTTAA